MEDTEGISLFVIVVVVAIVIYFGVTTAVKKSFRPTGTFNEERSTQTQMKLDRRVDDIRRQQEDLKRRQEQQMRDMRRR